MKSDNDERPDGSALTTQGTSALTKAERTKVIRRGAAHPLIRDVP
jgi:hypothetical protein